MESLYSNSELEQRLFDYHADEHINSRQEFEDIFWSAMGQMVPPPFCDEDHQSREERLTSFEILTGELYWQRILNTDTFSKKFSRVREERLKEHLSLAQTWEALSYYWRLELIKASINHRIVWASETLTSFMRRQNKKPFLLFSDEDAERYLNYPFCYQFQRMIVQLHAKYQFTKKYYGIETTVALKEKRRKARLEELLFGEDYEEEEKIEEPLKDDKKKGIGFKPNNSPRYHGSTARIAFQKNVERIEPLFLMRENEIPRYTRAEKMRLTMINFCGENAQFDKIKFTVLHALFAKMNHPL